MEMLPKRVKALGRPQVWIGSRRIARKAWGSRRAQQLFFLLINHPAGLTKGEIVERLFPEADGKEADGLFHSTLYRCRAALWRQAVVWEDHSYRIRDIGQWNYDVADFEALVDRARRKANGAVESERLYRTALQLYRGDYLEGWGAQWCEPIRERLRQLYVAAVLAVAKSCADRGLSEEALDFYRLAISKDYYSGAGHKGVTDCLLALGDRLAAMRHYSELVERLQEDVPPETRSEIPPLAEDMLGLSVRALLAVETALPDGKTRIAEQEMMETATARPLERSERFTQINNSIIDHILPRLSASAWKTLTVMLRQAASCHGDSQEGEREGSDAVSYSSLKERTGIRSDAAIARALKELLDRGYIVSRPAAHQGRRHNKESLLYTLKPEFQVKATRW